MVASGDFEVFAPDAFGVLHLFDLDRQEGQFVLVSLAAGVVQLVQTLDLRHEEQVHQSDLLLFGDDEFVLVEVGLIDRLEEQEMTGSH